MDNKSIIKGLLGDLENAIRSSDAVPSATKPGVLGGIEWLRRNIIDPPTTTTAKVSTGAPIDPDLERILAEEEEIELRAWEQREERERISSARELILNSLELERDRLAYEESNISEAIKIIKKLPLQAPLSADPR